jgi:hypothetical protein
MRIKALPLLLAPDDQLQLSASRLQASNIMGDFPWARIGLVLKRPRSRAFVATRTAVHDFSSHGAGLPE